MAIAASRLRDRSILVASAFFALCSLLFLLLTPAGTPMLMLVAAKSAMMIALIGLRFAAGMSDEAETEGEVSDDGR